MAPTEDLESTDDDGPSRRRHRNRNMTPQEKLVLIRKCCEHADKDRSNNKGKFWIMIRQLLKERTGYDLVDPRQTVLKWVDAILDELVEEEMGSGTEIKKSNFKATVEQLAERCQIVA